MRITIACGFLFICSVAAIPVWAANPNPGVIPPHASAFGQTYGQWSASWWQWVLAIPAESNPLLDETGADCAVGQGGKVWFLAGTFTDEVPDTPNIAEVTRECAVPTGKAVFFPIINIECSTVEAESFFCDSEESCRACAESFVDGPNAAITDLAVEIDGVPLQDLDAYRFQSPYFSFTLPEDNVLGVEAAAGQSVSDGYYLLLPPLSAGVHTVSFRGSFVDPENPESLIFGVDVYYDLTVVGGRN